MPKPFRLDGLTKSVTPSGTIKEQFRFRLVLVGKADKRYMSYQDQNSQKRSNQATVYEIKKDSSTIKWWGYSRFLFAQNSRRNSLKVTRAQFLGNGRLFCFTSINKFGNFHNLFAFITSLYKLHFRNRRYILFGQMKKVFL